MAILPTFYRRDAVPQLWKSAGFMMSGHGCPRTSTGQSKVVAAIIGGHLRWRYAITLACAMLFALFSQSISAVGTAAGATAGESMRVRVAWGGGTERIWQGEISLSEGNLSQPQPLGIEADESGSMWIAQKRLIIQQRSARAYDGVDLLLDAPLQAQLRVILTASDESGQTVSLTIPLKQLVGEFF